MRLLTLIFCFLFLTSVLPGCGGGSGSEPSDDGASGPSDDGSSTGDGDDVINTEKLTDTPFEGLTEGDDIVGDFFLCGQYRTELIEAFPIKIFAAYFTAEEEETIQTGVDIANEAIGFIAYELTDEWTDDARVIYAVSDDALRNSGVAAHTYSLDFSFNDTFYAEVQVLDWTIAMKRAADEYTVAHELGHATGIQNHALIDYEEDAFTGFNDANSIMDSPSGTDLPDYIFMMERQGQIMVDHLGESGELMFAEEDC